MKVTQLTIKNIGMIADTVIELNQPLLLFYGDIRQGKTTILNAVRWVFGGEFPEDIIRHGQQEAFIELGVTGGFVRREFYIAKDKTTKARSVVFVRDGRPVPSPVGELKRFLNPFLLDQDHFRNMGEAERKAYFMDLLGVDTKALDTEAYDGERKASELRAKIKGYGEIDVTPVEPVDVVPLSNRLSEIRTAHNGKVVAVLAENANVTAHNKRFDEQDNWADMYEQTIANLEKQLATTRADLEKKREWLKQNPRRAETPVPPQPDTSALESQISNAAAVAVRVEQYQKNLKRQESKRADEVSLSALENRGREIKVEKAAKLKTIADSCKIKDLGFDESGNFTYQGTTAGMLSTSQIMQLSSELSALYPEGFGIELLDRGESLGASIFDYVARAKAEEKTILATIVGERPAKVPENIGVFVVKDGVVKS